MGVVEYTYICRLCVVVGTTRVRHTNRAWGFHNVLTVRFLDGEGRIVATEVIPAGRFNRIAVVTGRKLIYDGPTGYRPSQKGTNV